MLRSSVILRNAITHTVPTHTYALTHTNKCYVYTVWDRCSSAAVYDLHSTANQWTAQITDCHIEQRGRPRGGGVLHCPHVCACLLQKYECPTPSFPKRWVRRQNGSYRKRCNFNRMVKFTSPKPCERQRRGLSHEDATRKTNIKAATRWKLSKSGVVRQKRCKAYKMKTYI